MHGNNTRKIPVCSYLYLKVAKMMCLSFYPFFFYKTGEQEVRGFAAVGGGDGRERGTKMNTVQMIHAHVCKNKNDTC
jgi:hypothetical protein